MGRWGLGGIGCPGGNFGLGYPIAEARQLPIEGFDLLPLVSYGLAQILDCLILIGNASFQRFEPGGDIFIIGHGSSRRRCGGFLIFFG